MLAHSSLNVYRLKFSTVLGIQIKEGDFLLKVQVSTLLQVLKEKKKNTNH